MYKFSSDEAEYIVQASRELFDSWTDILEKITTENKKFRGTISIEALIAPYALSAYQSLKLIDEMYRSKFTEDHVMVRLLYIFINILFETASEDENHEKIQKILKMVSTEH